MFDQYYYRQNGLDIIYLELKMQDSGADINLYVNSDLVDQKIYKVSDGIKWRYELTYDTIWVEVQSGGIKVKNTLKIDGKEVEFKKVKKKELKRLLTSKNLYNAVNPTKTEIEAAKFKFSEVMPAVVVFGIALVVEYFVKDKEGFTQFLSIIPSFVGGILIWGVLIKYIPFFRDLRKLGLGMVVIFWMLVKTVGAYLV